MNILLPLISTVLAGAFGHRLNGPIDEWFPVANSRAINLFARYGFGGAIVFVMYIIMVWDQLPAEHRRTAIQCLFTTFGLVGFGVLFGYLAERLTKS